MTKTNITYSAVCRRLTMRAVTVLALALTLGAPSLAFAQAAFAKPDDAANALIDAIAANDPDAISRLLGKDWRRLLPKGSLESTDKTLFLEKSSQSRKVDVKGDRAELVVGSDPWTMPIPLRRSKDGQWRFDPVAAQEVIAERRIGANERAAMRAVLAYVDAQREYASADRNGDGVLEYAQKLRSSPDRRDGLIWSPTLGDDSPLGEDYLPSKPGEGYHGYRYKILTGQGPAAPGGARSYLIGKRMTSGFALLAWPVRYGVTGVMSFMVSSDGTVFESNLGPRTAQIAQAAARFDPDSTWKPVQP